MNKILKKGFQLLNLVLAALVIYSSIIGAFVPDNWKEERQDRKEEQIILNGLKTKW
ncbi:MAG: hypothetical protein P8100_14865 [bacterium]